MGPKKLRSLKATEPIEIQVDGKTIVETESEKLLGVIVNNELTWKEQLYGEKF